MKNIVSFFDGMSGGQAALSKYLSKDEYKYYASEINKPAMNVAIKNFPQMVQMGDITKITGAMLPEDVFLALAGSPCQGFSIAGTRKGMITVRNIEIISLDQYLDLKDSGFQFKGESYLYWEYMRLMKIMGPQYFLLENVMMAKKWEKIITNVMEVEPIHINSNLLTAQNRDRLYWTNIPGVTRPENRHIHISEVVPNAIGGYGERGRWNKKEERYIQYGTTRKDGKSNCLTKSGTCRKYEDIYGEIHKLTMNHCEVLQGYPINFTECMGVSNTERGNMLGNGWSRPIIEHIYSFVPEFQEVFV